MSYSRSYHETITVRGSKTVSVSYPASQSGGSTSVTVNYTENVPIDVNIHVDTVPFDHSVDKCNTNVNLLTTAVVATETAQVASINKNSQKVADTIIGGFFGYIRSEISQQVAELSQQIDAQIMHLRELAQSCVAKKKQMENDYNRISGRYFKIFNDLNHELDNRVYELDKPTFVFKKETDSQKNRTSGNDLVGTVAIFGSECGGLQSKLSASIAKKRALDTLNQAKIFLWQQKKLNHTIQQSMLNENDSSRKYSPVCLIETSNEKKLTDKKLFTSDYIAGLQDHSVKKELTEQFSESSGAFGPIPASYRDHLSLYLNTEINKAYAASNPHDTRVKDMIRKLADLGSIAVIKSQNI